MAAAHNRPSARPIAFLLLLLLATPARSNEAPPASGDLGARLAALERAFERERRKLHVPGAALVVVQDDRVLLAKGFGDRDRERYLPVTPDTLFAIGSCTKAFTALTVMMSADDGRLSLTDSPKKYLPYFALRDPEADAKVTLADLLCHRSGLERTELCWYTGVLSPRDVIRVVARAKPAAKLGEKFLYQNVMYLVTGEVVAKAQGAPWAKVVERRIFRPLSMTRANASVRKMLQTPDHALGYSFSEDTKLTARLPMRDLTNCAPAGAINASARDLAPWLRFMLGDGSFEGKRLVSPERFRALTEKQITILGELGYGYGWLVQQWRGQRVLAHSGGIDGFTAEVALMPGKRLGVAVLANLNSTGLGGRGRDLVWEHLSGVPEPAWDEAKESTAAAVGAGSEVDPAAEAGAYRLAEANLEVAVAWRDGRLTLQAAGQPAVTLERVTGRRYKAGPPAPPGTFVTFRPAEKDAKQSEMFLEQGQGVRVVLTRLPPKTEAAWAPPITVEELMRRVIDALGGEENLRKHRTLLLKVDLEIESQGLTGKGIVYSRAPNQSAQEVRLYGLGKKIATIRECFDGDAGAIEVSYAPTVPRTGKLLADARVAADFAPELNWKTLFKSVALTKMEKVGDEEVYVVEKTPEQGNPVTDYISTTTFRLMKRESRVAVLPGTDALALPLTETFSDYRLVDGVMIPFRRVQSTPLGFGDAVVIVREAPFDARIPDRIFRAKR